MSPTQSTKHSPNQTSLGGRASGHFSLFSLTPKFLPELSKHQLALKRAGRSKGDQPLRTISTEGSRRQASVLVLLNLHGEPFTVNAVFKSYNLLSSIYPKYYHCIM
jgi:hypothetical protein